MMKRRKVAVGISIVCLFIAAIAIQATFGGGIGLKIEPREITVNPGSTITYDITISSHDRDYFNISVIPYTCKNDWFEWPKKKPNSLSLSHVYVPARGQKQILLNVTPSETGNFEFKVKAVSINNPRTYATSSVKIKVVYKKDKPDLIITRVWLTGNTIHYEVMNAGNGTVHKGWDNALFFDSHYVSRDHMDPPLDPCDRRTGYFDHKLICPPEGTKRIEVCADIDNVIEEIREDCNCLEKVLKCNQPPTCMALMPDLPQPQVNGTVINWTACAFDPEGDELWYRFLLGGPKTGGNLTVVQDWSTSNEWIWRTGESDKGDNLICVDVRDGNHANDLTDPDYDLSTCQWYWIA